MTIFKKIALFILFFPSFYLMADEVSLKKMIEASYPKYKVESIKKTSYSGLYEIFMGGQIIYTDERFSFLIAEGHIVDPKTKKDLTGERLEDLTKVDFSSLPLNSAIKTVKGDGSRKLVVLLPSFRAVRLLEGLRHRTISLLPPLFESSYSF